MLAKTQATSGTNAPYEQARELAERIEALLEAAVADADRGETYGIRLSQALTRSLVDQLAELRRHHAA